MKQYIFKVFVFCLFALNSYAQETEYIEFDDTCTYYNDLELKAKVYSVVSKPALFQNNCIDELTCFELYLYNNIGIRKKKSDYNDMWMKHNGRLRLLIIIDTNGDILKIKILDSDLNKKRKKHYTILEREAEKVIKKSPKWIPAICNNKNVISQKFIFLAKPYLRE